MTPSETALERSRPCDAAAAVLTRTCGTLQSVSDDAEAAVTAVCQCLTELSSAIPADGIGRRTFEKLLTHPHFQDRMAQRLANVVATLQSVAESLRLTGSESPSRDVDWEGTLLRIYPACLESDHGSTVELF